MQVCDMISLHLSYPDDKLFPSIIYTCKAASTTLDLFSEQFSRFYAKQDTSFVFTFGIQHSEQSRELSCNP